jgi:hypothetical protein
MWIEYTGEESARKSAAYYRTTYPGTLAQTVEAKLVSDLSSVHSVLKGNISNGSWDSSVVYLLEDPACWRRQEGEHHGVRPH